jgi:hypothetical protein
LIYIEGNLKVLQNIVPLRYTVASAPIPTLERSVYIGTKTGLSFEAEIELNII